MSHDARCEAHWNDGVCACAERVENALRGWFRPPDPPKRTRLGRLLTRLRIYG